MSDHLVHFTKEFGGGSAYQNIMSILAGGRIEPRSRFGIARNAAPDPSSQMAICFSEVPLHQMGRIAQNRSDYGVVFRKDFAVQRGANPILYAYRDGAAYDAMRSMMVAAGSNPQAPIWRLTPFVDAPGTYGSSQYFFEWEREWRKLEALHFEPSDVAFLIIPESHHEAARFFFDDARTENTGPCYDCPFVDPYWDRERVTTALATIS